MSRRGDNIAAPTERVGGNLRFWDLKLRLAMTRGTAGFSRALSKAVEGHRTQGASRIHIVRVLKRASALECDSPLPPYAALRIRTKHFLKFTRMRLSGAPTVRRVWVSKSGIRSPGNPGQIHWRGPCESHGGCRFAGSSPRSKSRLRRPPRTPLPDRASRTNW